MNLLGILDAEPFSDGSTLLVLENDEITANTVFSPINTMKSFSE